MLFSKSVPTVTAESFWKWMEALIPLLDQSACFQHDPKANSFIYFTMLFKD